MTKHELIDHIQRLNPSAPGEFLTGFDEIQLQIYLERLLDMPRNIETGSLLTPLAAEDT